MYAFRVLYVHINECRFSRRLNLFLVTRVEELNQHTILFVLSFSLTTIVIPYACPNCSDVLYCSEHCLQHALATYHQYECQYIPVLTGLGIAYLGSRQSTPSFIFNGYYE
jgi:hypothetical protein